MEGSVDQSGHVELVRLVQELRSEVAVLREENQRLRDRVRDLEGKNPTVRLDEPYSVEAEEKRREVRADAGRKENTPKRQQTSERRGRRTSQEKIDQADAHQIAVPEGFDVSQCVFVRERPVWRIIDGRATLVVYEIWHGPNGEKPVIPGVLPRSEFGTEIQVTVAFLVSIIGLSMDKVCLQLKFFWNLDLAKSQADAILTQLSSRWEQEFETLCDLVACSAVVHADETGWSINSVWAFLSEQARVLVFGCRKDADTLAEILPKDNFAGVLVSDDAAVYQGFSHAQKCWAHLLRKAIRLTLLYPDNDEYQSFLNGLMEVFREAKRIAADGRFGPKGRAAKVNDLDNQLADVCMIRCSEDVDGPRDETDREFQNLVHEVVRLMVNEELFAFVVHDNVSATNNEAERSLRGAALDRRTGRTSKTVRGARRRTVLVSVFETLKLYLPKFTLANVVEEVVEWCRAGESRFSKLRVSHGLGPPNSTRLQTLIPAC